MSAPRATTCWRAWTAVRIFTAFPSRGLDGAGPSPSASRPRRGSVFSAGASRGLVHVARAHVPRVSSAHDSDGMTEFRENQLLHRQATGIRRSRETEHEPPVIHAAGRTGQHGRAADLLVR